jgi:hypothetical protein
VAGKVRHLIDCFTHLIPYPSLGPLGPRRWSTATPLCPPPPLHLPFASTLFCPVRLHSATPSWKPRSTTLALQTATNDLSFHDVAFLERDLAPGRAPSALFIPCLPPMSINQPLHTPLTRRPLRNHVLQGRHHKRPPGVTSAFLVPRSPPTPSLDMSETPSHNVSAVNVDHHPATSGVDPVNIVPFNHPWPTSHVTSLNVRPLGRFRRRSPQLLSTHLPLSNLDIKSLDVSPPSNSGHLRCRFCRRHTNFDLPWPTFLSPPTMSICLTTPTSPSPSLHFQRRFAQRLPNSDLSLSPPTSIPFPSQL